MTSLLPLLPWLIAMLVLIGCSGFFSASEAALFYLKPSVRRGLRNGSPSEQAAGILLRNPDRLLSAVLFWNLLINITYFTISSIVALRLEQDDNLGQSWSIAFASFSLLTIIFLSEMLPKSLAVLKPLAITRLVSLPLSLAVRLLDPLMPLLQNINTVSKRILAPGFKSEPYLETTDLERAIELTGDNDASVIKQEQAVLQNIVQLSKIRVDEWMRPRTQFVKYRPPVSLLDLRSVPASGYLLVTEPDSEEIEKAIRLDNLFQLPEENVERLAEPVLYLPWSATVADALEKMSHRDREVTVVVNEFGETIGVITIEDILETVFTYAPSRSKRLLDQNPLHPISDGKWVVSGMLSLRQLSRELEVDLPETHSVTVAGVIQENMQRLAKVDDHCDWGQFHFRVIEMPQRGHMLVELTLREKETS